MGQETTRQITLIQVSCMLFTDLEGGENREEG